MTLSAKKGILCVEDDKDTLDMRHFLPGEYGYEAVIGSTVSDALESARPGGLALAYLIIG